MMAVFYYLKSNMDIKKSFWEKLREFRKKLWYSQESLAMKCDLHRTYIWNVERWEKNISLENIEKLSKALWIKIKDLF